MYICFFNVHGLTLVDDLYIRISSVVLEFHEIIRLICQHRGRGSHGMWLYLVVVRVSESKFVTKACQIKPRYNKYLHIRKKKKENLFTRRFFHHKSTGDTRSYYCEKKKALLSFFNF